MVLIPEENLYLSAMTVSWLFYALVPVLEAFRIYFLASDIHKLALAKGEPARNWVLSTIVLWVGVETAVIALWWWINGARWMVVGIFLAIVVARVLFSFLKKNLEHRPDVSFEDKIDEIGSHGESQP